MPYPNEHAARMAEPDQFDKMRRENGKFGEGIDVIWGINGGKTEIQAIRFDKEKFTPEEAKTWLKEHDYKPIEFEPATDTPERENASPSADFEGGGTQDASSAAQRTRMLAIPFKRSRMVHEDGGLLVHDVTMLAAGTWTDSAVQTALNYPERTLQKYATNWSDTSGWARHAGGSSRDATDKVAEVRNPRFQDGAVVGDIFIHGYTQKSRDVIELVKRKLIAMVSVEHTGREKYNSTTRQLESESLNFSGFAFVHKGACTKCRINEAPSKPIEPVATTVIVQEETMTDTKELESKIEELTRKLADMSVPVPVPVPAPTPTVNQSDDIAELRAQVKELMARPAAPVAAAVVESKQEYAGVEPETHVRIDPRARAIGGW